MVCADREDVRLKPAGQHGRTGPACDRIVAGTAIDSGVATLPYPAHYPLKSVEDCI